MISVIIPTWNAERTLTATLSALVPALVDGVVREVILVDSGSTDQTVAIADSFGARVIQQPFLEFRDQKQFAVDLETSTHVGRSFLTVQHLHPRTLGTIIDFTLIFIF